MELKNSTCFDMAIRLSSTPEPTTGSAGNYEAVSNVIGAHGPVVPVSSFGVWVPNAFLVNSVSSGVDHEFVTEVVAP